MDRSQTPKPGELYRQVKNQLYQVIAVADHMETKEKLVICQALYGSYGIYAVPLAVFMGEEDGNSGSDTAHKFRFERVRRPLEETAEASEKEKEENQKEENRKDRNAKADGLTRINEGNQEDGTAEELQQECSAHRNPLLLPFIESRDFSVKLEILSAMEGKASREDLDMLCEALDLPVGAGDVESQMRSLRQYLEMRIKFDSKRLR